MSARDDGPSQDPDESLIDECCLLPSQLLVPSMDWLPVNDGVIVKLQGKHPLRLQFGKASSLPGGGSTTPLEAFTRYSDLFETLKHRYRSPHTPKDRLRPVCVCPRCPGSQKMDNLRCVHMGVCPTEESKACTR